MKPVRRYESAFSQKVVFLLVFCEQIRGVPAKARGSVVKLMGVSEPLTPVYSLVNDIRPSSSISSCVKWV